MSGSEAKGSTVCVVHDRKWQLVDKSGQRLCCQCCQQKWMSSSETTFTRRQCLESIESAVRYGTAFGDSLVRTDLFGAEERIRFLISITELLFHSDPEIQCLAKNCLTILLNQMNDKSFKYFIFHFIIENMSSDTNKWNQSVFEVMVHLYTDCPFDSETSDNEFYFLFESLGKEFNEFNDEIKANVLLLLNGFYDNYESNQLFRLDEDFHLKTLRIVFLSLEPQIDCSNDRNVLLNSIELLKKLSTIGSIVNRVISDSILVKDLRFLLGYECEEIQISILVWICDVLEMEEFKRKFSITLLNSLSDSLIDLLYSSDNTFLSNHLLNCINLILDNSLRPIPSSDLMSFSKAIVKSLQLSVNSKDNKFFMNAMTALKQLLIQNPNIKMMSEFELFTLFDVFQFIITDSDLFVYIVDFMAEFLQKTVLPVVVPTTKMKSFLDSILKEVSNLSIGTDTDSETIEEWFARTSSTVCLIKEYMNLIKSVEDNESVGDEEVIEEDYVHVMHENYSSNEELLEESSKEEPNDSNNTLKESEIYDLLMVCLRSIEMFFEISLEKLISNQNSDLNSELFQNICSCFASVIESDFFLHKDIDKFIDELFSNGNVLIMVQILWFYDNSCNTIQLKASLASFLAHILYSVEENEYRLEPNFDFDKDFDRDSIERGFCQLNDDLMERIDSNSFDSQSIESLNHFYSAFFAINYYCLRTDSKKVHKIDERYDIRFTRILNQHLKYNLSVEKTSVLTIRHSLFLSAFTDIEEQSVCALRQFFIGRDETFLALYYTNHMLLLQWIFDVLKCDNFCSFALKSFFDSISENYRHFEKKQMISTFFQLIHSNDRALQVYTSLMCETIGNHSTLDLFLYFLEDSDQFVDESDICNNWNLYSTKVFQKMPTIVLEFIKKLKIFFGIDMNPEEENNFRKLLNLLCRMLSNELNKEFPKTDVTEFYKLITDFTHFVHQNLKESTIEAIFEFFRICLKNATKLYLSEEEMTKQILDSNLPVILMIGYINNDLTTIPVKCLSLFLLYKLSENKCKYRIEHQLVYELDINRLISSLNSTSKLLTEMSFKLLSNSFRTDTYFSANNKEIGDKFEELKKLIIYLQNAVFRGFVSLTQMTRFLSDIFKHLETKYSELVKHLASNPWFRIVIENYIEEKDVFEEELIQFLILFVKKDFINNALIEIINKIIKKFIEFNGNPEMEFKGNRDLIRNRIQELFEEINSGVYRNVLDNENKIHFKGLSKPLTKQIDCRNP